MPGTAPYYEIQTIIGPTGYGTVEVNPSRVAAIYVESGGAVLATSHGRAIAQGTATYFYDGGTSGPDGATGSEPFVADEIVYTGNPDQIVHLILNVNPPRWRGEWEEDESYVPDDEVFAFGNLWRCLVLHYATLDNMPESDGSDTYWLRFYKPAREGVPS